MICQVSGCREVAITLMFWPDDDRGLQLCPGHTGYYQSIAGSHMRFEAFGSEPIDLAKTPEFAIEEARRKARDE